MTVKFKSKAAVDDALAALRTWRGHADAVGLPSSPEHPLVVTDAENRPQPKRDVWVGRGMTTVVGRVRADAVWDLRLVALSHNVVRGAAGGSVQNAELLAARGGLPPA